METTSTLYINVKKPVKLTKKEKDILMLTSVGIQTDTILKMLRIENLENFENVCAKIVKKLNAQNIFHATCIAVHDRLIEF